MKIGVAIADDEELFKIGIAYILSRDPDIQIVFEAINVGILVMFRALQTPRNIVLLSTLNTETVWGRAHQSGLG